jgi:hypothetical protein
MLAACMSLYLLTVGCAESYPIWKKLDDAPLPMKVNALVTGHRNVLSRQRILAYEGWRVKFALDAPTATANTACAWQVRCEIEINPLSCETANGSQENCSLRLDTLDEACALLIERSREKVAIACPVDIIFGAAQDKLTVMKPSLDGR